MNVCKILKTCAQISTSLRIRYYGSRPFWLPTLLHFFDENQVKQGPQQIIPRYALYNWDLNSELYAFSQRISAPIDLKLLTQVFVNPTFIKNIDDIELRFRPQIPEGFVNDINLYMKLLSQGETYMHLIVMAYLRFMFKNAPEELLESINKFILSDEHISNISIQLGMKDLIISQEYPPSSEIYSQTLKSLIGAILSDESETNKTIANKFILDFILTSLIPIDMFEIWPIKNVLDLYKSLTNKDFASSLNKEACNVEVRLIRSNGINTIFPIYVVGIFLNKNLVTQGVGETIPIAIDQASREAIKKRFGFIYQNMGCSLDFDYQRILPILCDKKDECTGHYINTNFYPNPSINDMLKDPVDFMMHIKDRIFSDDQISDFVSPINHPVTLTHDDHMYQKVIK